MLPELKNIKSLYPFAYTDTSDSAQLSFMHSIRRLSLWVQTNNHVTATVIQFTPTNFKVKLQQGSALTIVQVSSDSFETVFQDENASIKLASINCFVEYADINTASASCNLQLLPQIIVYIPTGLQLYIGSNKIHSIAQNGQPETIASWNSPNINFLPGYNFQGQVVNNNIIMTAGVGLGLGSPSTDYIRNLLQKQGETQLPFTQSDSAYIGVRGINGQSGQLQIDTSASLYLKSTILTEEDITTAVFSLYKTSG